MVDLAQVHRVLLVEDLAAEGPVAELLEWVEAHILAVEADNLLEIIVLYSLHDFIQLDHNNYLEVEGNSVVVEHLNMVQVHLEDLHKEVAIVSVEHLEADMDQMWDPEEVRLKGEGVYHNLKKKSSIHVF